MTYSEALSSLGAAADAEVAALTATINAKQSWIDGAKVDLDGYDDARAAIALAGAEIERASVEVDRAHRVLLASNAERDDARDEVRRLRAIVDEYAPSVSFAVQVLDERDDARAAIARVRALHVDSYQPTVCDVCEHDYRMPCGTLRALDGDA